MLFLYTVDFESTISSGNVELLFVNNNLIIYALPTVDSDIQKDSFEATGKGL